MPLAEIASASGRIGVQTEYHERDLVKTVPGARYAAGAWSVPLSWTSCQVLRGVFGPDLAVGAALRAWAQAEKVRRITPSLALRDALDGPAPFADAAGAWPHVKAGVAWMLKAESGLLLDEMGGGKTAQAILFMRSHGGPNLVVTTNSMLGAWAQECARWWPGCRVSAVTGSAAARRRALEPGADVYLLCWANLAKHSRLAPYGSIALSDTEREDKELNVPWTTVVADEVHRAKNPRSKQTRALWHVGDGAQYRWGLSGTNIVKVSTDLWSPLRFASAVEWPSRTKFVDRWCRTNWTAWGITVVGLKPETMDEFDRCTMPRWRRVPATVFRGERPEPAHHVRKLELAGKQKTLYRAMESGVAQTDSGPLVAFDGLARVLRLWQAASSCLDADGRPVLPSAKVQALREFTEDQSDEQIVIFAHHRRLLRLAWEMYDESEYTTIVGGQTSDERSVAVAAFQAGEKRLLFASYGAGGEGITLNRAHIMVTLQDSWRGIDAAQAVGRLDRGNTTARVEAVHLRSCDTIDEAVPLVAAGKTNMLQEFVRDQEGVRRLLTWGRE